MIFDAAYASAYEAERAGKPGWRREAEAVAAWLTAGPVLDVPIGTGRFVPLYRERGADFVGLDRSPAMLAQARARYPGLRGVVAGAHRMPFPARRWAIAVCLRLLPWLEPAEVGPVVAELGRVAGAVILSARVGEDGARCWRGSRTHSMDRLAGAVSAAGLRVTASIITAEAPVGSFRVMLLERL